MLFTKLYVYLKVSRSIWTFSHLIWVDEIFLTDGTIVIRSAKLQNIPNISPGGHGYEAFIMLFINAFYSLLNRITVHEPTGAHSFPERYSTTDTNRAKR